MKKSACFLAYGMSVALFSVLRAQPAAAPGGVLFHYRDSAATSVSVVGDFNAWSRQDHPLREGPTGLWSTTLALRPGRYQYKFVVNGTRYERDPANPAVIDNYNGSSQNSVFVLANDGRVLLKATMPELAANPTDRYSPVPGKKPVYLNIIWHQHQPLYLNPETDQLTGPWVRTHATKDYYDMAAILKRYPDIHCTINLTSSLLLQLRTYYVDRLRPFVDTRNTTIDVEGFLKKWRGKTDPWIDLALKPTARFTSSDRDHLYRNIWNAFGVSEVMLRRFPEYSALQSRLKRGERAPDDLFSEQELRDIKFWFFLAHFDPDFLQGPVTLEDGSVCDLSGYVLHAGDGTYRLRKRIGESDCRRIVVEAYKVMSNVIPVHRALRFSPESGRGQIDVITTPYYHPILPLLYDTDLARICQPDDPLPPRFSFPEDARAQVVKAVTMYREIFGSAPSGMWPGEGALALPVLEILRDNGILWSASDVKNLRRSDPPDRPNTTPYAFPAGKGKIALVFRDTELSDRIGFKYQDYPGEEAAEDFVQSILSFAPGTQEPDVLITVILDGENAWEWYRKDADGKIFLNALYRKLTKLYHDRRIITATPVEYLTGNSAREIEPHPLEGLPPMQRLWPGSWINANYDTWIGEREENRAWEYLLRARSDLARSGLPRPDPASPPPGAGTKAWHTYSAWESMYAAEGSDWFWWYGSDQEAPGGDEPFDTAFRAHLRNVYSNARRAGARLEVPQFPPILLPPHRGARVNGSQDGTGAMARSRAETRTVILTCDARAQSVLTAIYVVGSLPQLGAWVPNRLRMCDDGTGGDERSGDGIWTIRVELPLGVEIQYKYTNSGEEGRWEPGDEAPGQNRSLRVDAGSGPFTVHDIFGKRP